MRSSLKTKTPLRGGKPLERKTRLRPVSAKRKARQQKARAERREMQLTRAPNGEVIAVTPITVRTDSPEPTAPQHKAVEFVSLVLMDRVHQLPCRRCGKPQLTAQHFPPQSVLAVRDDRLIAPLCGSGTTGCHGEAQRREISNEVQLLWVGETLALFVKEGLVSWPGVEQALRNLGTVDIGWATTVRGKVIEELAIRGEERR